MMLKCDLHDKKVLLFKYEILNNSESDILVTERLVKSFSFTRLISVIVIICAIQAMS